jgi:thioredoxin 1
MHLATSLVPFLSVISVLAAPDLQLTPHRRQASLSSSGRSAVLSQPLRLRGGVRQLQDAEEWETLQEEAGDKLIVLDFTATWCGPCQRIAPAFAAMADEMPDVIFVKADVDELGDFAAEMGVSSMPTFLLFRGGEEVATMRGADEEGLRALIAEHAMLATPA